MLEVLTMGRVGVDLYPLRIGVSLRAVTTFGRLLGGSPANVAGRGPADPGHLLRGLPPDDFPLSFHRLPTVPDLQIRESALDLDAIRTAGILWVTVTGLCEQPSRDATLAATWPDRPSDPRIPMTSTVERRLR